MAVAAIIVGDDESQVLVTRRALDLQSHPADYVLTAESQLQAQAVALNTTNGVHAEWLWLLTAGMTPQPEALAGLLSVIERSPSATWIAPKLVRADRGREIVEYGLTVSRFWNPISPVATELDQAQHDHKEDLLAATAYGSLLRVDALEQAGGFDQRGNTLTNDYRLAIAMRLAGHRVLAAPLARIGVPEAVVGFNAQNPLAQRKTQIQLLTGYSNPLITLLGGLFAPIAALLLSVWLVLVKRPERISTTLAAGFWWFGTAFGLLARRPKLGPNQRPGLRNLRVLFATREDIQRSFRAKVEQPAAIAEANLEATEETPRFFASGGFWYMVALAALSWQFWPKGLAMVGGGTLPLGDSLAQLFSRAGASWQHSGFGLAAPSDPFGWVLFGLGAITFWAPSLSLTLLVFLVKPLAFASAWRLLSLVTRRKFVLVVGALAYAFWPALSTAQLQARVGTIVALVLLPLFVFTLARILQFGASPRRSVQTWTWVGTSALLAAVISAGAPSLTPLLAVLILLLAVYRFKRIGYLMWIPIPLLVIWLPYGWYLGGVLGQPLQLLNDPGVPVVNGNLNLWQLLLGGVFEGAYSQWLMFLTAGLLVIGLAATLTRRSLSAMWLWLAMLAAVATAFVLNQLWFAPLMPADTTSTNFDSGNIQFTNGGPYLALAGFAGLIAAVLLVVALDAAKRAWLVIGSTLGLAVSLVLAAQFTITSNDLRWTDGSRLPALVLAQAAQNPDTRTLVIQPQVSTSSAGMVAATLVSGSGINLQDLSTAYNLAVPALNKTDARYQKLGQLTANLISANGAKIEAGFKQFGIDYVLVPNQALDAQLGAALDTVPQLEPVGVTDFGRLYRVKSSQVTHQDSGWEWSVTKQVQVAVLGLFALLAIPTRRRVSSAAHDEEELDAFEGGFEGEAF